MDQKIITLFDSYTHGGMWLGAEQWDFLRNTQVEARLTIHFSAILR